MSHIWLQAHASAAVIMMSSMSCFPSFFNHVSFLPVSMLELSHQLANACGYSLSINMYLMPLLRQIQCREADVLDRAA